MMLTCPPQYQRVLSGWGKMVVESAGSVPGLLGAWALAQEGDTCAQAARESSEPMTMMALTIFTLLKLSTFQSYLSCMTGKRPGQVEHVIKNEQHHGRQVSAQGQQAKTHTRGHRDGTEMGSIELLFPHIVERVHHQEPFLGVCRSVVSAY